MGATHPLTNKLEAHNCWIVSFLCLQGQFKKSPANTEKHTDVQKEYVALAVEKGWAVIDVNVPMHISRDKVGHMFFLFSCCRCDVQRNILTEL